jgi:hypothetical protein
MTLLSTAALAEIAAAQMQKAPSAEALGAVVK